MSDPTTFSRRVKLAISGLALTTLVAFSAGVALKSSSASSPLGASVVSIASLLNARSPGKRTEAELTRSKQVDRRSGVPAELQAEETERVLGKVFPPVADDHLVATPEELLGQYFPAEQGAALSDNNGEGQLAGIPLAISEYAGAGGGGIGGGSSSGGGSSGGGASSGGGGLIPPEQIPAVPEPSTWALMLLGAAMCGASMRRQRSIQLQSREA